MTEDHSGRDMPVQSSLAVRSETLVDSVGNALISLFHRVALFAIGAATFFAGGSAFIGMMKKGGFSIGDLLLLFIYLEIGAMVGIYFKTKHLPVRFLIFVGITALTRLMIEKANVEHVADFSQLFLSGAILLLACAVVILNFGATHYGNPEDSEES